LIQEELDDLRKAGVTDNVIKFLLDPSQPYAPPRPGQADNQPAARRPGAVLNNIEGCSGVSSSAEPGLYFFRSAPIKVDINAFGRRWGRGSGQS
jgi:hypothetical protein